MPGTYLPRLTAAFKSLDAETHIDTTEFVQAVDAILPIFDHLGSFFSFAKSELTVKRDSLAKVSDQLTTLNEIVAADVRAGRATVKDSCARNLHRLITAINFIRALLQNLASDPGMSLRSATSAAYDGTLAEIHTYMVRMAVKTSLLMLPSRETFLASIGETDSTAREHCKEFVPSVDKLVAHVMHFYSGTLMPRSESTKLG